MNQFTLLQRYFMDFLSKALSNAPSYATSFLLFSHHSSKSLHPFHYPNYCKPLVLAFNDKPRSEAERNVFVCLSATNYAELDAVLVQTAKRLHCCSETRMI